MNIPVISVVIPTYNRKELLEKAILSVINQKKDIPFERELIIVDDGGTD
jgi:glycosyltransferase involved in cell wall biosynthesis